MRAVTVAALAALSAAPALKAGDVQALEIFQLLSVALAAPALLYRGVPVPASGAWRRYGPGYLVFMLLALATSALALRLTFYAPPGISILKQPGVLSLARTFELTLAIGFMLAAARAFEKHRSMLRMALDTYAWVGIASAWVSIGGWVLRKAVGISTFAVYGYEDRARGFFNEGGPYGIYLVSVGIVLLLRTRLFPPRYPAVAKALMVSVAAALALSGSKAGWLAVLCLSLLATAVTGSTRRRIAVLASSTAVLLLFLVLFQGRLFGYFYAYLNFDEALAYRPNDPSLIMGRITGAIVTPRMIAAHPVSGIGVGNYSLMRNDPEYLQGLPPVDDWDLAGMGLVGSAAEFGIPLTLLFVFLLLRPLLAARRRCAPALVAVAAGFQPLAFLLGVNLNFFYPWLIAAFVIGLEPAESR